MRPKFYTNTRTHTNTYTLTEKHNLTQTNTNKHWHKQKHISYVTLTLGSVLIVYPMTIVKWNLVDVTAVIIGRGSAKIDKIYIKQILLDMFDL